MTVAKTVEYGRSRIGDNESPRGSNRGWFWTHVSQHWGVNLSGNPWCGAYVIDCAKHGGLKLPWQWVSVHYAVGWGRARGRYRYGDNNIHKGDAVILFGGKHIEFAERDGQRGGVWCLGGNTGGSEPWQGGTVARTFRTNSQIMGSVKLYDKYPKPPRFAPRAFPLKKVPMNYFSKKLKFPAKIRPRIHNGTLNATDKANVARIQSWLKYLGYYDGKITGVFNLGTWRATVKFQKAKNYKNPNGAIGPGTWLALQKAVYNKKY
jgi:hypothetical protein